MVFCSISGEAPTDPVVSTKSGHLFEKRLLLKYVQENGSDPVSGESMTEEDILQIQSSKFVKPRTPAASSLPNLLLTLQNEYDAIMLETFSLKQSYQALRLELANAMYENDAAKRVIARLVKERDEARQQLASFRASAVAGTGAANGSVEEKVPASGKAKEVEAAAVEDVEMETEATAAEGELSPAVIEKMESVAGELSAVRRKKKAPESLASVDSLSGYTSISRVEEFQRNKGVDVVTLDAITTGGDEPKQLYLVAGQDNSITIVNSQGEKLGSQAKAHSKHIHAAVWGRDETVFFTASEDGSVKVWSVDQNKNGSLKIKNSSTWKIHNGPVKGLSLHPTKDYIVTAGADGVWTFTDVASGEVLLKQKNVNGSAFTSVHIHPDGLILGTGSEDSVIRLWDLKTGSQVQTFEGHTGPVTSLEFSENGYYLATASNQEKVVKFWDLRKLANTHTLDIPTTAEGVSKIRFDKSGVYIGSAADNRVWIHVAKKSIQVAEFQDAGENVRDIVFGPDASYVVIGSQDSFQVFGQSS